MAESGEYTDGGVGPYSSYYTSLLIPPDKYHNVSDFDHTFYVPASDRIHLCMNPCWYRDPGDGPDIEAIRKDWEIYHYLVTKGVVGRWSHVFRPAVENDDPIWYFQRMNRDGSRGLVITKHAKLGPAYYMVSKPKAPRASDVYFGGRDEMCKITTTKAARADTGIYEDLVDHQYRYYGVPGEVYGPLNFKYASGGGLASYITSIWKLGSQQKVKGKFFGMAIQMDQEPITLTHLGQYADANTLGIYTLMVLRGEDGTIFASTDIDMSYGYVDVLGFKYAALPEPVRLDAVPAKPVVIKPRGLDTHIPYDVQTEKSGYRASVRGHELMEHGVELKSVEPGELIFLNLPNRPGSGSDRVPPGPPQRVTKRLGSNLGVQGIEIAWTPGHDNNWISYYEVLREGDLISKVAKGTFFFDCHGNPRERVNNRYQVRTVDGDGNRSEAALAEVVAGEPETYTALGGFGPTQGSGQWKYEESLSGDDFRELRWDVGGYEGRWMGSAPAIIGRIWMQPGEQADVSRTFVAPANGSVSASSSIRKDPSAQNGRSVRARILHNRQPVWPKSGWAEIPPNFSLPVSCELRDVAVSAGDVVRFVVQHSSHHSPDPVIWNPAVTMTPTS